MSIDATIRDVAREGDDVRLFLEPRRYRPESVTNSGHFSIAGQHEMVIEGATWTPAPGLDIWGGSGSVEIVVKDGAPRHYERIGYTRLREKARP